MNFINILFLKKCPIPFFINLIKIVESLLKDLNLFGLLFECMSIRDLKVYRQKINGDISFYRDENNFEVDAIFF